jgi:hypothetical protein
VRGWKLVFSCQLSVISLQQTAISYQLLAISFQLLEDQVSMKRQPNKSEEKYIFDWNSAFSDD